jgi:predicted transcriptional regulator
VHQPEAISGRLSEALFEGELSARAYRARTGASSLYEAIAGADPDVADLLQRFAVEDANEDVDAVMIELIDRAARRVISELEREARQSSQPLDYGAVVSWLKLALEDVRNGQSPQDGESALVAWLVSRFEVGSE